MPLSRSAMSTPAMGNKKTSWGSITNLAARLKPGSRKNSGGTGNATWSAPAAGNNANACWDAPGGQQTRNANLRGLLLTEKTRKSQRKLNERKYASANDVRDFATKGNVIFDDFDKSGRSGEDPSSAMDVEAISEGDLASDIE